MAFKMKGFPMHGTKKFEDDSIINSAPKKYEAHNGVEGFEDTNLKDGRPASSAFQQKETQENWEPAYEGGDHSWRDLEKMSTEELKSKFPDTWENVQKDLAKRKGSEE